MRYLVFLIYNYWEDEKDEIWINYLYSILTYQRLSFGYQILINIIIIRQTEVYNAFVEAWNDLNIGQVFRSAFDLCHAIV